MCYCAFSKDCCAEEPSALLTTVIKRQPNNCLVMCYCTFSKESRASLLLSIHIVIVQIVYNFLVVYNNRLWRYLWKKENYNKILATFPVIMIANGIVVSKPTTLLTNNLQIFWTAPRVAYLHHQHDLLSVEHTAITKGSGTILVRITGSKDGNRRLNPNSQVDRRTSKEFH